MIHFCAYNRRWGDKKKTKSEKKFFFIGLKVLSDPSGIVYRCVKKIQIELSNFPNKWVKFGRVTNIFLPC